jgi:hypothetical protein
MKLLHLDPDFFPTVLAFATEIRDTIAELNSLNLTINDNSIMGLVMQMNLHDGPVKEDFVKKVEQNMYTDLLHKTPRFDDLLKILYVSKQQVSLFNPEIPISSIIPSPPSPHHLAVTIPPSETPELHDSIKPIDAKSAKSSNCHICQQPGHWLAKCPHRKRPVPPRAQQPPGQRFNLPPNLYNQANGYQPYCPIVVSPNFLPYGALYPFPHNPYHANPYPPSLSPQQQATPRQQITQQRPNNPNDHPYKSYKPNYNKRPNQIAACNVNVGTVEDKIAELQIAGEATADALSMGTKIISDTGASSHLTGDRSSLFEFKDLRNPIRL